MVVGSCTILDESLIDRTTWLPDLSRDVMLVVEVSALDLFPSSLARRCLLYLELVTPYSIGLAIEQR